MSYVRPPAVAGSFYEGDPQRLREQVERCIGGQPRAAEQFIGVVSPHAGLMYSGRIAGVLYQQLNIPKRLIILCPNHTGVGTTASINSSGSWRTPLGLVPIDEALAAELRAESSLLQEDVRAHAREHSLEVQLPFLQHVAPDFMFVPICLALGSLRQCEELGGSIARVVQRVGEPVGIIASSDFNHYEDQRVTMEKDQRAIEAILELDPSELWSRVRAENISMCGYIPATVMLYAARALGATRARLLMHATSGDVNGDYDAVVGYASIIVS